MGQAFFLVQLAARMIRFVTCLDHSNKTSSATAPALAQTNWAAQVPQGSHLIVPLADVRSVVARIHLEVCQTALASSSFSCSRPFDVAMAAKSRGFSKMTEHVIAQIVRMNPHGIAQLVPAQSFATKTSGVVWIFIFSALRVLVLSASRSSTTTVVTAREHVQTRRTGRVKVVKPVAMDVLRIPLVELEMIVTGEF